MKTQRWACVRISFIVLSLVLGQALSGAGLAQEAHGETAEFQSLLPLVVRKYLQGNNSVLDPTFDGDGKLYTDFGFDEGASGLVVQPDGKMVAAGTICCLDDSADLAIACYNPDGSLDASFGGSGKVIHRFGTDSEGWTSIALQADGKIIVGGYVSLNFHSSDFALVRINPNGLLDISFSNDGIVLTDIQLGDRVSAVVVQPDGKILAAGYISDIYKDTDFAIARYNPDGTLDTTFGVNGVAITDFYKWEEGYDVLLQPDGKIIVGGLVQGNHFGLVRYNPDGSLDTSFGEDGLATDFDLPIASARSVALQSDGKIVMAGGSHDDDFALVRFNADGSLDLDFGTDGIVTTDFGCNDYTKDIAIRPDGTIVAAGTTVCSSYYIYFAVARYQPDGNLDLTFGDEGKAITNMGEYDYSSSLALQEDGKMVVAGSVKVEQGTRDFILVRYK